MKELSQAWRDVLNMQFGINKAELHTLISSCSFANDKDFTELVSECWALFNPDDQKLCVADGAQCGHHALSVTVYCGNHRMCQRSPRALVLLGVVRRIDTLGVVCTFGIECKGSFDDKIDFIFDTFDLNGNGQLNRDELVRAEAARLAAAHVSHRCCGGAVWQTILCLATMLGLVRYIKPSLTPPSDEVCEEFSLKAFQAVRCLWRRS